jgi:hypothetical protein
MIKSQESRAVIGKVVKTLSSSTNPTNQHWPKAHTFWYVLVLSAPCPADPLWGFALTFRSSKEACFSYVKRGSG